MAHAPFFGDNAYMPSKVASQNGETKMTTYTTTYSNGSTRSTECASTAYSFANIDGGQSFYVNGRPHTPESFYAEACNDAWPLLGKNNDEDGPRRFHE